MVSWLEMALFFSWSPQGGGVAVLVDQHDPKTACSCPIVRLQRFHKKEQRLKPDTFSVSVQ